MYKNFQRAIIIGGGSSIRDGLWNIPISELPLWSAIQNECTFGINYLHYFFEPTALVFCDFQFHKTHKNKLDKLPFLLALKHPSFKKCPQGSNLITLPGSSDYYGKNSLDVIEKKTATGTKQEIAGLYSPLLSGIFTLTLCVALGFKEIYLLGYDYTEINGKTHFYQDEAEKTPEKFQSKAEDDTTVYGIGRKENGEYRTNIFEHSPAQYFDVYIKDLDEVKIYNVSPNSKITTFPKLSYAEFYQRLHDCPELILQDRMREHIKEYLEMKLS